MPNLNALFDTAELPVVVRARNRVDRVDWRLWGVRLGRLARRLPLLALMALPFLLGWSARLVVRALFGLVWALGWAASWCWFTALEGWYANAGRGGGG